MPVVLITEDSILRHCFPILFAIMPYLNPDPLLPVHPEEFLNNTSVHKMLPDEKTAKAFFKTLCSRLLHVNAWKKWSGNKITDCKLCDRHGNEAERPIRMFDYFRISCNMQSNIEGKAYEWLRVEGLEKFEAPEEELMLIEVRQVSDPDFDKSDSFTGISKYTNNSFIIRRIKKSLTVEIHGRNEQSKFPVTTAFQWRKLAKGLISSLTSKDH